MRRDEEGSKRHHKSPTPNCMLRCRKPSRVSDPKSYRSQSDSVECPSRPHLPLSVSGRPGRCADKCQFPTRQAHVSTENHGRNKDGDRGWIISWDMATGDGLQIWTNMKLKTLHKRGVWNFGTRIIIDDSIIFLSRRRRLYGQKRDVNLSWSTNIYVRFQAQSLTASTNS